MNNDVVIPLVAYMVLVFAISLYSYFKRDRVHQLSDYFIGNRSLNGLLLAMTLTATYISASSFIGGPGAAYKYGLGWVLLSMIQLPAIWLSLGVLGKKFAILARRYQAVTLTDVLYQRYQSKLVVIFASASLIIAFIFAMTVQFIGAARLLETSINIDYTTGLLIFGLVTTIYTSIGGFKASVLNDVMQGAIMIIGAILLVIAVIHYAGGVDQAVHKLVEVDPELVSPYGADGILTVQFMASFWLLVCFGVIGLPHTAVRCMAYRDSKAVHRGIVLGTIIIGILMLCMHVAGALGRTVLPGIDIPDKVIPALMIKILPPMVAGIFLAAPLAAIMSTINAQLLQVASVLINDLYLRFNKKSNREQRHLRKLSILITFVVGILLIITAYNPPKMIIWLNILAFGGLQAVFLWPLVLGLYWSKANAVGALCSMIFGISSYTLCSLLQINIGGFHPIVPSLLGGGVVFLMANYVGGRFSSAKEIQNNT